MKKFWMMAAIAALALVACDGSVHVDGPDAGGKTETDTGEKPDNGGSTETDTTETDTGDDDKCKPKSEDCDGDGVIGEKDCMPFDENIYPGADDVCGDGVDSDCDGEDGTDCPVDFEDEDNDGFSAKIDCDDTDPEINQGMDEICGDGIDNDCKGGVDNGCGSNVTPCPEGQKDNDGDGSCALDGNGADCNDQDPGVKPGLAEVCDGKDNNCNGVVDEGCEVQPPPTGGTKSVYVKIEYSDNQPRTLSVGGYDHKSSIFHPWLEWDAYASSSSKVVEVTFLIDASDCGIIYNVAEGYYPVNQWFCMGNAKTPEFGGTVLDADAKVTIVIDGKQTYYKKDTVPVSDLCTSKQNCGCAGGVAFDSAQACQL